MIKNSKTKTIVVDKIQSSVKQPSPEKAQPSTRKAQLSPLDAQSEKSSTKNSDKQQIKEVPDTDTTSNDELLKTRAQVRTLQNYCRELKTELIELQGKENPRPEKKSVEKSSGKMPHIHQPLPDVIGSPTLLGAKLDEIHAAVKTLAKRNNDAIIEKLRPQAETQVNREYRWAIRILTAGITISIGLGAMLWWNLLQAKGEAQMAQAVAEARLVVLENRDSQLEEKAKAIAEQTAGMDIFASEVAKLKDEIKSLSSQLKMKTETSLNLMEEKAEVPEHQ